MSAAYTRHIRKIPDFPKPGILFRDITPLLLRPEAFHDLVDDMAKAVKGWDFDRILGIESRGFLLGSALAYKMKKGLIIVRKPNKLPAPTVRAEYTLEYGTDSLEMHKDAVTKKSKVLILDDVIATGGTAKAATELVQQQGGKVAGCLFLIELKILNGKALLGDLPCKTMIQY